MIQEASPSPATERTAPRILVVDLETTGLRVELHSIVQIGAVWLTGATGEFSFDCRMWDGAQYDPKAGEVNGLSEAWCRNPAHPDEAEALHEFMDWIHQSAGLEEGERIMIAGLNVDKDRQFLHAAARRAQSSYRNFFPHRLLDLHSLAVSYALAQGCPIPSRGFYTDEIYALLDLPPEPRPHVAITGARRETEALRMLMNLPEALEP